MGLESKPIVVLKVYDDMMLFIIIALVCIVFVVWELGLVSQV